MFQKQNERGMVMVKVRKVLAFMLVMMVCMGVFAGCGNKKEESAASNKEVASEEISKEQVTLKLMYWDKRQTSQIEEMIQNFEQQNPNIKVEATIYPWNQYWQKLQTVAVGSDVPDIFWMNVPNIQQYVKSDILLNLQPFIEKEQMDLSPYPESLVKRYTIDGNSYSIPLNYDTIALMYNKEIFDQNGIQYPDENWDWDQLKETANKLTVKEDNGNVKHYGFASLLDNQPGYYNFIASNGGGIISDDLTQSQMGEKASIESIDYLLSMLEEGISPSAKQMLDTKPLQLFVSGKLAMMTTGSWTVPEVYKALGDKFAFAPLPISPNTKESKSIIHGVGWSAYSQTKHPEEAWKLLKHMVSKESLELLARDGITIPSYAGMEKQWVETIPSANLQVFIDAVQNSVAYPASLHTSMWQKIEKDELTKAWFGEQSAEQAMKKINEEMNEVLKSEAE
jgi:multiple sugar transport system substrate-binding protein